MVQKINDNYVVSIPLIDDAWDNSEFVIYYKKLRYNLQNSLRGKSIVINLCSGDDINDVKKVLE